MEGIATLPGLQRLDGPVPAWHAALHEGDADGYRALAAQGRRLVALWSSDEAGRPEQERAARFSVHAALAVPGQGLLWLSLPTEDAFPSLSAPFPAAVRMERMVYDLHGLRAEDLDDHRPWLRHGAWPADQFPLRKDFPATANFVLRHAEYPFVRVRGEGVHQIPVGPVHAGIIEPGHFRFQVVGEKVLRLEQRLGYKHKGIEKRFEGMDFMAGARLAGRVSGDSTVAHALAYAQALESLTGTALPERAHWLRALCLERERVANHLGDLGALGNDAGLTFGLAQFGRLKEGVLEGNRRLFGHRYLMDAVIPGGLARDLDAGAVDFALAALDPLLREVEWLQEIYEEHAGLQDRFSDTGRVEPALAARLGLMGFAGRASGQPWDLRVQFPTPPYQGLNVNMALQQDGDVEARVTVRFEELKESLRLQREILTRLPPGEAVTALRPASAFACGLGWVEGWRGEVFTWVRADGANRIDRCHPQDPSWVLWPALEYAILGNIVPDFPLINKSFNLSYSGHDL